VKKLLLISVFLILSSISIKTTLASHQRLDENDTSISSARSHLFAILRQHTQGGFDEEDSSSDDFSFTDSDGGDSNTSSSEKDREEPRNRKTISYDTDFLQRVEEKRRTHKIRQHTKKWPRRALMESGSLCDVYNTYPRYEEGQIRKFFRKTLLGHREKTVAAQRHILFIKQKSRRDFVNLDKTKMLYCFNRFLYGNPHHTEDVIEYIWQEYGHKKGMCLIRDTQKELEELKAVTRISYQDALERTINKTKGSLRRDSSFQEVHAIQKVCEEERENLARTGGENLERRERVFMRALDRNLTLLAENIENFLTERLQAAEEEEETRQNPTHSYFLNKDALNLICEFLLGKREGPNWYIQENVRDYCKNLTVFRHISRDWYEALNGNQNCPYNLSFRNFLPSQGQERVHAVFCNAQYKHTYHRRYPNLFSYDVEKREMNLRTNVLYWDFTLPDIQTQGSTYPPDCMEIIEPMLTIVEPMLEILETTVVDPHKRVCITLPHQGDCSENAIHCDHHGIVTAINKKHPTMEIGSSITHLQKQYPSLARSFLYSPGTYYDKLLRAVFYEFEQKFFHKSEEESPNKQQDIQKLYNTLDLVCSDYTYASTVDVDKLTLFICNAIQLHDKNNFFKFLKKFESRVENILRRRNKIPSENTIKHVDVLNNIEDCLRLIQENFEKRWILFL